MPKVDGFKLYEELRKIDKDVKVVFVTAFDVNYGEVRTLYPELAIDSFSRKPNFISSNLDSMIQLA